MEAGTIKVVSGEPVGSIEVAFTFDAGDLARNCIVTQILMRSGAGVVVDWSSCPI